MEVKVFLLFWRHPATPKPRGGQSQGRQGDSVSPGSWLSWDCFLRVPKLQEGIRSSPEVRLSHCSPSSCEPLVIPGGLVPAWLCHSKGSTKPQLWEGWSSSRSIFHVSLPCCHHRFLGMDSLPCLVPLCCSLCLLCTQCWGLWL